MTAKAAAEANQELIRVAVLYGALLERYENEIRVYGQPSEEARQMLKDVDRRAERIYK